MRLQVVLGIVVEAVAKAVWDPGLLETGVDGVVGQMHDEGVHGGGTPLGLTYPLPGSCRCLAKRVAHRADKFGD